MAEKRGNTGKLLCDFPTHAVLEVLLASGKWHRVTSVDFRSWTGERRITYTKQPGIGDSFENIEKKTLEYIGPVYLHGTNLDVKVAISEPGIMGSEKLDQNRETSKKRDQGARI